MITEYDVHILYLNFIPDISWKFLSCGVNVLIIRNGLFLTSITHHLHTVIKRTHSRVHRQGALTLTHVPHNWEICADQALWQCMFYHLST